MTDALKDAAAIWFRHCFQLKRTEGFYDRGVYRKLDTKLTTERGNVQPASQAQVERLPEGARSNGAISIFTCVEMVTAESPNQVADRVLWRGVEYEVTSVERWASHGDYVCTKVAQ